MHLDRFKSRKPNSLAANRVVASLLLIPAILGLSGCNKDVSLPDWQVLAQEPGTALLPNAPAMGLTFEKPSKDLGRKGTWIWEDQPAKAWLPLGDGIWKAPRTMHLLDFPGEAFQPTLLAGNAQVPILSPDRFPDLETSLLGLEEGESIRDIHERAGKLPSFCLAGSFVFWIGDPSGPVPPSTRLRSWVDLGLKTPEGARLQYGSVAAEGWGMMSGWGQGIDATWVGQSDLIFATQAQPTRKGTEVTFALEKADREIWRWTQSTKTHESVHHHRIELGFCADGGERLTFRMSGPTGVGAILDPRMAPAIASKADPTKPNVVLFIADSLRADSLGYLGGKKRFMPNLNRLAKSAVRLESAYAPSTHTYNSMASILTGAQPFRLGNGTLPEELPTLAAHMRAQGYHTVAITQSNLLREHSGLDRGFEWFEQHPRKATGLDDNPLADSESLLERVREVLDHQDGRPLFLVVHSAQTTMPFQATNEALEMVGLSREKLQRVRDEWTGPNNLQGPILKQRELVRLVESAYRASTFDLDHQISDFWKLLGSHLVLKNGFMMVVSNHGQSIGEHVGDPRNPIPWQSTTRAPWLIWGPELEPVGLDIPVGLVHVPTTICKLLGIRPARGFELKSALQWKKPIPILAYQPESALHEGADPEKTVSTPAIATLIQSGYKALFSVQNGELGPLIGGFNLSEDPEETRFLDTDDPGLHALIKPMNSVFEAGRIPN